MTRGVFQQSKRTPIKDCFYSNATNAEGRFHYEHVRFPRGPTQAQLHYNPGMARLICFCLVLYAFSSNAAAQVKIHVPQQHQKKYEKISASVENSGRKPVTFCVEFGQWSPKGDGQVETTPYPFWVQQNHNGKWSTLINGPDVGSNRGPVVLVAGKSMEFPFRLGDSGQMRVRLNYWNGDMPTLDCHAPPKGAKLITSSVFTVE